MLRLRRSALAMLVVVLIAPHPVEAQNTSQVFGRATDASGAVLPGVTVTLSSQALLEPRVAVTGATGTYEFSGLPIGVYAVKFELSGFTTLVRDGLQLQWVLSDGAVDLVGGIRTHARRIAATAVPP